MQYVTARGLYQTIMERMADGKRPFLWHRVALYFFDDNGKPLLGEHVPVSDLCRDLGVNADSIYSAVHRCRTHGLPLLTVRPNGVTDEGSYVLAKTERQARQGLEAARAQKQGGIRTLADVVEALAETYPALQAQRPHLLTEENLRQLGGDIAVVAALKLSGNGEEDPDALPSAST